MPLLTFSLASVAPLPSEVAASVTPLPSSVAILPTALVLLSRIAVMIRRIEVANGHVLYRNATEGRRVMSEVTAFLMASMLADVVDHGTGYNARVQGFKMHPTGYLFGHQLAIS